MEWNETRTQSGKGVVRCALTESGPTIKVMGYHTIKEGEQALVFSTGGRGTLVIGPRRVSTEREREKAHGLAVAF